MTAEFTTPTSNTTFPPTLSNCEQNPQICPFMKGTLLENVMYDAKCLKPLPDGVNIEAKVAGWEEKIQIPKSQITKVMCGKCDHINGVERSLT